MSPLVKKEIRLLLPSWGVAVLLALVQAITRSYDFYIACLLFLGLTMMALTSIGRESSMNTFSLMLAQPAERLRIWQTKLSVLAVAFAIVLGVWLIAFVFSVSRQVMSEADMESTWYLLIAVCLIATATFTGGLWTALLLRQLAAAFWLTLLVPATLSGFAAAGFTAQGQSDNGLIAGLCVVFAIYSIGGFLFARWLFFRAQDTGWTGGIISLPDWPGIAARRANAVSPRNRKPVYALVKKELQLHQTSLMAAAGLLVLHVGVMALRKFHPFAKGSAGEILTGIFWMLWLTLPVVIGCLAVAEERRLGVMEGQQCQPASRRIQFGIKGFWVLFLGFFLGGVMPVCLEAIGVTLGAWNPIFMSDSHAAPHGYSVMMLSLGVGAFSAWLALVSFFASSLAKSFLQAIGLAVATFIVLTLFIPAFTQNRMMFFDTVPAHCILPLLIAVPTLMVDLFWLAYLNYKNFRDGWPLWRRNLLGLAGAMGFVLVSSTTIYHRVWEVFEPAEPAHGAAKLSLTVPPTLSLDVYDNLLVRLPDGRVWFDHLSNPGWYFNPGLLWSLQNWRALDLLPRSLGPQTYLEGSNWVSAAARYVDHWVSVGHSVTNISVHVRGYQDTVGLQSDGTLWVSERSDPRTWTASKLTRFGNETNWQQLARTYESFSVLLLKKDGTLWRLGTNQFFWQDWPKKWPGLRAFEPYQIGADSDWAEISSSGGRLARKTDGSVWGIWTDKGTDKLTHMTNFNGVALKTFSRIGDDWGAYVRPDGTLWTVGELHGHGSKSEALQIGTDTNWVAVAMTWNWMVALKSDGTLWQWNLRHHLPVEAYAAPPTRLGIHNDWVAIAGIWSGMVSLAADGSLWFWPDRQEYEYYPMLMKLPKQPRYLGNIFGQAD